MSANFIVEAEVRTGSGTAASRRARRNGQVPVVVYGGGEDEQYLLVDHNKILLQLNVEAFHSALVQLSVGDDLQRARKDKITMTVPLHFVGEENAPGVKTESGIMTHSMTNIDIYCLGSDLPEYVEVNVSELGMGDSVSLGEVKLPEGVEFASTVQDSDLELPVASVLAPKKPQTEEAEEAEGEEGAEGEAAEGGLDE